jgi:REP-associated tyrosine transposase
MPWGLKRYQNSGAFHFITFSCYRRQPLLTKHGAARMFEQALEEARIKYGFFVFGYVVMPEHVHLLVSEPERATLATAIKAIKQSVARRQVNLGSQQTHPHNQKKVVWGTQKQGTQHFWQPRYYDFNVFTDDKRVEKLQYMHHNPVKRGLVELPEQWPWSSYRHYATGEVGTVEIESPVSAWKRRQFGNQNALVLPQE